MSSNALLILLMGLPSFLILPGAAAQTSKEGSVAELLLRDEVQQAAELLDHQPKTAETIALRGEIEYRHGSFEKAEALYNEALKMAPRTARAHFGLGKLAIAKLKAKDAIQSLTRAIEMAPAEPLYRLYAAEAWGLEKRTEEQRKQLEEYIQLNPSYDPDRMAEVKAGLEMLQAFGTQEIGAVQAPDNPAPIRFRKSLNLIFARVMVNGQGPYEFAIDTGASQTVLSERLAADLGLKAITTTIMHGVGGAGKVESRVYRVDEIDIGDLKIRNLPVGTFNDPLVTQLADGIIGTSMLSDFIVTVNYPEGQMELVRKAPDNSDGAIPAWYFSNLLLVTLEVTSPTGTHRGNFVVDTGAVTTVLSHRMAKNLGVDENTPGAKIDFGVAGVGGLEGVVLRVPDVTFRLQTFSESYPQVVAIDLKQISKMIGTELAGVLGYDFFADYRLTLDYHGAQIRLTK
jgi:predicted aspartyl protease